MVQMLYIITDDLSTTSKNSFSPFKVNFGSTITVVPSEVRSMVKWFYGFVAERVKDIENSFFVEILIHLKTSMEVWILNKPWIKLKKLKL